MTVGDKIKKIRTFRGMTQKELGLAIGFEEKGADNRIAQYETNYRVPKRELLDKMAEALRVDRQNFYTIAPGSAEDFMRTFFWLDEDSPGAIRLFQLVRNPGRAGAADDTAVRYNDSDDWPAHPPVGMYFQYGLVDEFMREWLFRQQELHAGEITREEYESVMREKTGGSDDFGITYEEFAEQMGRTYEQCQTIIFNQDGERLTPTAEFYGKSVNAVRGMDISELKIYVFDDMDLWVQAAEEGADSEALNQAVLSADIDVESLR